MKRIALLLSLLMLCSGCNKSAPTATDLMAKLLAYSDLPVMQIYFNGAAFEDIGYLSREQSADLYCGQDPMSLSDEYAIALCKDDRICEIHLYHALDAEKADAIEAYLRKRQTLLLKKEYYFYDTDHPAASSVIWKKGKWVCLLVTHDNERAICRLREAL